MIRIDIILIPLLFFFAGYGVGTMIRQIISYLGGFNGNL